MRVHACKPGLQRPSGTDFAQLAKFSLQISVHVCVCTGMHVHPSMLAAI